MTDEPVEVVIVDDHHIFRHGLSMILLEPGAPSCRLVGEARTPGEALALVERLVPDVLVADLKLGDSFAPGLSMIRRVRELSPHTRVLALTAFDEHDNLVLAFEAGATGCMSKADQLQSAEIRRAIAAVAEGQPYHSPVVLQRAYERLRDRRHGATPEDILTPREREILALIARHYTNPQIATELSITVRTAKAHVSNILSKLQLASRSEAALFYEPPKPET